MRGIWQSVLIAILISVCPANTQATHLATLYARLDPKSITQHLALYQLYPQSREGHLALHQAWVLLSGQGTTPTELDKIGLFHRQAVGLGPLLQSQGSESASQLSTSQLELVDRLARHLSNRKLKGFRATSEKALIDLSSDQIDLARGLFLSQTPSQPVRERAIRNYEAMLDLMALQIQARLAPNASDTDKIQEMNRLVFEEMNFRFPPHSLYAKDIDVYTYLPSVLDSRRGVCLGVSILYACLGQRLDIPLELITPPGHIFVQYKKGDHVINIETTARGVHVDSEEYLGLESKHLQRRSMKEAIGLAHINEASIYLKSDRADRAVASYQIARKYLPNDPLLTELLGYAFLLNGQEDEGRACLEQIYETIPSHAVSRDTMAEDFLRGRCQAEDIRCIFQPVDASAESLRTKRAELEAVIERSPGFRAGWLQLATILLQLHRLGEALPVLQHLHELDSSQPTVEYYLAVVYAERFDFNKAWAHLNLAEKLLQQKKHHSSILERFRRQLFIRFPVAS